MKREKFLVFAVLAIAMAFPVFSKAEGEDIACAQDVKKCSDGSYVNRVPPTCAFKKCPGEAVKTLPVKSGVPVKKVMEAKKEFQAEKREIKAEFKEEKKNIWMEAKTKNELLRAENKNLIKSGTTTKSQVIENRANIKDNRIEALKEIKAEKASTTEKIREERAELKNKMTEALKDKVRFSYGKISTRLSAEINRLEKIISRLESRSSKMAELGVNVVPAKTLIDSAKTKLKEAVADLAGLKISLETAIQNGEPQKDTLDNLKTAVNLIQEKIKEAHKILNQVIPVLAKANKEAKKTVETSSTTPSSIQ